MCEQHCGRCVFGNILVLRRSPSEAMADSAELRIPYLQCPDQHSISEAQWSVQEEKDTVQKGSLWLREACQYQGVCTCVCARAPPHTHTHMPAHTHQRWTSSVYQPCFFFFASVSHWDLGLDNSSRQDGQWVLGTCFLRDGVTSIYHHAQIEGKFRSSCMNKHITNCAIPPFPGLSLLIHHLFIHSPTISEAFSVC